MAVHPLLVALALPVLACASVAQGIVAVSGGGAALQTAVAAAATGSILVVAPGQYLGFEVVDKDVTIVAPQRATVGGPSGATPAPGGPQRTLRLRGLDFVALPTGGFPGYAAGVVHATDHLHVEDCTCQGLVVVGPSGTSRRVLVADTVVHGNQLGIGSARFAAADVVLVDSSIAAAIGFDGQGTMVPGVGLSLSFGSLRAERLNVQGVATTAGGAADAVFGLASSATFADCSAQVAGVPGASIRWNGGACALSGVTANGPLVGVVQRPLATASWTARQWTPAGTSHAEFREAPGTAMAVVAAWELRPWQTPVALETLWIGLNASWAIVGLGVTDQAGALPFAFTIPNVAGLQHSDAWLTGVAFDPIPLRTTAPIGGAIR